MTPAQTNTPDLPEVAFYYPGPIWRYDQKSIKNLLLFFDSIGILLPNYMHHVLDDNSIPLMRALREHNALRAFEPEILVNKDATRSLAESLVNIIVSGAFDRLKGEESQFLNLSMSRLGFDGDEDLAQFMLDELKSRGLAKDTGDGRSISMHHVVRSLILVLLSQILRDPGRSQGVELVPATDQPLFLAALKELLSIEQSPSVGNVISFDCGELEVDASDLPLDEVIGFRKDNKKELTKYERSVRRFVHDLSLMPAALRLAEMEDRKAELKELKKSVEGLFWKTLKHRSSITLGLVGASWTAYTGTALGAALAAAGAVLRVGEGKKVESGAYTYLVKAKGL